MMSEVDEAQVSKWGEGTQNNGRNGQGKVVVM